MKGNQMEPPPTLDQEINSLFRRLDELKAKGEGGADASPAYMACLFDLRDKCRARETALLTVRA